MKTLKAIALATLFLTAFTLNAQEKKMTFGVKVGLNLSNVTTDEGDFNNTKSKAGFLAGVTLDYAFTPQWYLSTGVEYTLKGVKIDLSPNDQNITAAYVQVPVTGGFRFPVSQDLALVVNAGPYFAYGLHGKIKQGSYEQDTFSDDALKNFDCGIRIGAGLE